MTKLLSIACQQRDLDLLGGLNATHGPSFELVQATPGQDLAEYLLGKPDCVLLGDPDQVGVLADLKHADPTLAALIFLESACDITAISRFGIDDFEIVLRDVASPELTSCLLKRALRHQQHKQVELRRKREEREFFKLLIHDLKANFRAVSQSAAMLLEDVNPGDGAEIGELLGIQEMAVARGNQIFSSVETYRSLQDRITAEAVDLSDVISRAEAQITPEFGCQRSPVMREKLPIVEGSQSELVSLFKQLISNGLKFNETASPQLTVNVVEASPTTCTLAIEDNGIGVPEEFHSEIFKPLRRLWPSDVYPGCGLGLAICKKVVERHSGEIWCDPQTHKGSRFLVSLPLKQPA